MITLAELEQSLSTILVKDEPFKVLEREKLQQVASFFQQEADDLTTTIRILEVVADLARVDENREILGELDVIPHITKIFLDHPNSSDPKLEMMAARAIGNLCYENKENAAKVTADERIYDKVVSLLNSSDTDVQQKASGSITNLAWENEDSQVKLVAAGAIESLANLINPKTSPTVLKMVSCALANFSENNDLFQTALNKAAVIPKLFDLLKESSPSIRLSALNTLTNLIPNGENGKDVAESQGLGVILDILTEAAPSDAETNESDLEALRDAAAEVLQTFSEKKETRAALSPLLQKMIQFLPKTSSPQITVRLLTCMANISDLDTSMEPLFESRHTFLKEAQSEIIEHKIQASVVLGNLARGDDKCITLANDGLIPVLLTLLETADARVQHLGLGIARNLSLPAGHRQKLLDAGILQKLIALLGSRNAHVLLMVVSLLRHFILLGPEVCHTFIEKNGLTLILPFATELNVEEHKRILYESARVLAALILTLNTPDLVMKENDILKPLVQLVQSEYNILQLEGARAISRLADFEQYRSVAAKAVGIGAALASRVKSSDTQVAEAAGEALKKLSVEENFTTDPPPAPPAENNE